LELKIKEIADLTGVTVRTLHYYDEIGLLHPSKITDAGYRIYDETALEDLHQILFFRELDFSLSQIKAIISNPSFDKKEALSKHKELLTKKRDRLNGLIELVNKTIKGDKTMSFKEFDTTEIEKCKNEYEVEVKERWGNSDAYVEFEKRTKKYSKGNWQRINTESKDIFDSFVKYRNEEPDSKEVQALVKEWQDFITNNFYNCSTNMLSCLGMMYVNDERFKNNINKNGEGTAELISKAIEIYCANH
jgi:DNA-binding transcriptional MerR regulator